MNTITFSAATMPQFGQLTPAARKAYTLAGNKDNKAFTLLQELNLLYSRVKDLHAVKEYRRMKNSSPPRLGERLTLADLKMLSLEKTIKDPKELEKKEERLKELTSEIAEAVGEIENIDILRDFRERLEMIPYDIDTDNPIVQAMIDKKEESIGWITL